MHVAATLMTSIFNVWSALERSLDSRVILTYEIYLRLNEGIYVVKTVEMNYKMTYAVHVLWLMGYCHD